MKKLIALTASAVLASSAAIADIALTGSASVSYDDNGSSASATTYDADITITGTAGDTTLTASYDMEGSKLATTAVDMSTTIGPVTIDVDMFDEVVSTTDDGDGDAKTDGTDTSVSLTMDIPVGDFTVSLDDSGDLSATGTFGGVAITYTEQDGDDKIAATASIAGLDITIENDAGATTWDLETTISGVTLILNIDSDVSAEVGMAGNTVTVSHVSAVAYVAGTATVYYKESANRHTTIAIERDLTSGATLTATYSTNDDSLILKAAVSF